jgi:DNA-binding protein H-NS
MAQQLKTMDVPALIELRGKIDAILSDKRKEFEAALAALGPNRFGNGSVGNGKVGKLSVGKTGKRAKAPAKFRSKKDPKQTWSGRGMMAGWLKAEMKSSGKPREFFAIK